MNLLDRVTYASVRAAHEHLGHPFFTDAYDLNVGAVRSNVGGRTGQSSQLGDAFDDVLYVAYTDAVGRARILTGWGTTDPGLKYLRRKLSSALLGRPRTPILLPGHYRQMYDGGPVHGYHRGYRALRQLGDAVFVADVDTDDYLDLGYHSLPGGRIEMIPGTLTMEGVVLANRHRASRYRLLPKILGYSAACTVWQDARLQAAEIDLVARQAAQGLGTRVSNTLLTRLAL